MAFSNKTLYNIAIARKSNLCEIVLIQTPHTLTEGNLRHETEAYPVSEGTWNPSLPEVFQLTVMRLHL